MGTSVSARLCCCGLRGIDIANASESTTVTLAQLDLFHAARSASDSGALVMRFANEPETLSTAIPLRE